MHASPKTTQCRPIGRTKSAPSSSACRSLGLKLHSSRHLVLTIYCSLPFLLKSDASVPVGACRDTLHEPAFHFRQISFALKSTLSLGGGCGYGAKRDAAALRVALPDITGGRCKASAQCTAVLLHSKHSYQCGEDDVDRVARTQIVYRDGNGWPMAARGSPPIF